MPPTQLAMPFLRPLAPPKSSTVRTLLRFSTTPQRPLKVAKQIKMASRQAKLEKHEYTAFDTSSSTTDPRQATLSTMPPAKGRQPHWGARPFVGHRTIPQSPALSDQMPYWIQRTQSGNLPIYRDTKRGGNLHIVQVRKVIGNSQILAKDLRNHLELEKEYVAVEPLSGNIKIKCPNAADLLPKVAQFLEAHKF